MPVKWTKPAYAAKPLRRGKPKGCKSKGKPANAKAAADKKEAK